MRTAVTERPRTTVLPWFLRVVGAALLAGMGWIHVDLWLDGYRTIDVIGPPLLFDVIAGFGLAVLLLWWESFWGGAAAVVVLLVLTVVASRRPS